MASTTPSRQGDPCPDPAAHQHHNKLSEQASTAALYVTRGKGADSQNNTKESPLGSDGKLSAASAAASLKYANPQSLPSFPSVGLAGGDGANRAATLAKDYKMKELWQPEMSSAGSKAALLAHRDGGKLDLWQATPSKDGNSAAVLAMRGAKPFELDRGYTPDGKEKALLAATLSVNRGRSGSVPTPQPAAYPDAQNSSKNALNAAAVSHRQSIKTDGWDSEANQAARVKNLHVNPRYFTGTPDIDIDPDETKHQAALRASAASMAKQMYEYQNRTTLGPDLTGGLEGAGAAAARQQPDEKLDVKQEALRYIHLQDAAHKLAQERLAKIDKDGENARYREYYGYPDQQASPPKKGGLQNRLSVRGRGHARAGSQSEEDDSDDEQQARRIRHQMTQLSTGVSAVDEKKRSEDRARLLAAAEKRVHNQMHDMDERVFADTGKVPPAMLEEWEEKAKKRAQEDRELAARPENKGKTHIGGGKFIDQAEIDAIAAARLKPTLDEINDTAERKRARDEEIRLDKEEQEREKAAEKQRHREEKDEQKRIKNEEKAARRQVQEDAKARKEEEKAEERARKEEEKRVARGEQRKSKEVTREANAGSVVEDEGDEVDREVQPEKHRSGIFGRVASKLRRDREARESKKEEAAVREPVTTSHTGAVAGVGAGAATVGGVAVADHEQKEEGVEAPPVVEPTEATATVSTAPTLERTHTGSQTDPTATVVTSTKPNLERHISTLGHSDDDFSDDEAEFEDTEAAEETDRRREQPDSYSGLLVAGAGADGAVGMGSYELAQGSDNKLHPVGEESTNIPEAAPVTTTGDATGPAPHTTGPHESDIANIVDPRVKPDPELQRGAPGDNATGPAFSTIGPHKTDTANILDPRVQPDLSLTDPREANVERLDKKAAEKGGEHHTGCDAAVVGGPGAAGPGAYAATRGDGTGPAPNTVGPHSSDIANIVDPRVKPDLEKMGKQKDETAVPVASSSVVPASHTGAPAPSVKTGPDAPLQAQEDQEKEKKGFRGFFDKLRHRNSKSESEPGKLKQLDHYNKDNSKSEPPNLLRKDESVKDSKRGEIATGAAATGAAATDLSSVPKDNTDTSSAPPKASTDTSSAAPKASTDTASATPKMSTDTYPAGRTSTSSFKRGEGGVRNFSSASSADGKSDTDSRGRRSYDRPVSAYLKAEFGLGDLSKGMKLDDKPEEEEEFQEARDHFDENLAPPPAFVAGGKSESPVRGTRFREEV